MNWNIENLAFFRIGYQLVKLLMESKDAYLELETRKFKNVFIVYDSFMNVFKQIITSFKHVLSNNRRVYESHSQGH